MTQQEFEETYLCKYVRIKGELWPNIKNVQGTVTAALLDSEEGPLIAVRTTTHGWCKFMLNPDLHELSEFEIL